MIGNRLECDRTGRHREVTKHLFLSGIHGYKRSTKAGAVVVQCVFLQVRIQARFAAVEAGDIVVGVKPFDGPRQGISAAYGRSGNPLAVPFCRCSQSGVRGGVVIQRFQQSIAIPTGQPDMLMLGMFGKHLSGSFRQNIGGEIRQRPILKQSRPLNLILGRWRQPKLNPCIASNRCGHVYSCSTSTL
jgi:hypothetical protein